jgi:hypothetical protein
MLPWLAITYTTARLGFEAQHAAAFRLLRLAAGTSRATGASEIIPEQISFLAEKPPAAMASTPVGHHAAKKVHKKSAPVRRRGKRTKRS